MAQLQDSFMLDDSELEGAQPDSIGEASDTETANKVSSTAAVAHSSEVLAIDKASAVDVAMSDDKLDELKSTAEVQLSSTARIAAPAGQPDANCIMERLAATSACGLAHPAAAATLRQRQDGLNNSLVRLVRTLLPSELAGSKLDAVDQPAPFAKPKPKPKKRTLTQQLTDKVGNKENASAASNSQPSSGGCGSSSTGKQGCERNKAQRLADQSSTATA